MARGAGIVFFGIFISRILGYILRIFLWHVLGKENFGLLWSSFNVIEMVTFLCLFGIPNTIARYVAFYRAKSDHRRVGGFILMGFVSILPVIVGMTILLFWQSDYFATTLFKKPDIEPFLRILSFGILPLALMFLFGSIFRGFKLMPQMVFTQQLSRNIFMFLSFGILMLAGLGADSGVWALLSGLILTALFAILMFFRNVDKKYITHIELSGVFTELFHYSWPLVFTTFFWNMSGRIDVFFLTIYESKGNVGVYNALLPLAQFVPVIMQSFISILMPIFSGIFADFDRDALESMQRAATKWITALTLPFFLLLIIFSDSILLVLFGEETVMGTLPLCIAGAGYFIHAILGVLSITLNASGNTKLVLLNTSAYMAVNVLFDIFLIPKFGLNGAALSGAVSMLVLNTFSAIENYKLFKLKPFNRQTINLFLISSVIAAVVFGVKYFIPIDVQIVKIAVGSFLFILLYFIGLKKINIFDHNDLAIITAVEHKFGKKLNLLRRFID